MSEAKIILSAADKTRAAFDSVKGNLQGLHTQATAVLGALGALGSITMFASMIKGSIDAAAGLNDLSIQTGATVEALSALGSIGKLSDISLEQIGGAMNKLAKNMAGATEESKGAGKAIEALGLNFDAFKKLNPEDQMQAIAKAMDNSADGSGKAAAAMALYGKEGAKMLPFLKDLAQVGDLQAKVTAEQAAMADNFADNLTKLQASGEAWKKELAMGMLPALDLGVQAFTDITNGSGGLRDEVRRLSADGSIKEWTQAGITGLTYVADAAQYVIRAVKITGESIGAYAAAGVAYFSGIGQALKQVIAGDFSGAVASMKGGMDDSKTIIAGLGDTLISTFGEDTVGSRIRARMKEIEATGAAAEQAKPKLDFTNVMEKNAKADKAAENQYASLMLKIQERIQLSSEELKAGRLLTDAEKQDIKVTELLASSKSKLSAAQRSAIESDMQEVKAKELLVLIQRAEIENFKEIARLRQSTRNSDYDQSTAALRDIDAAYAQSLASVQERVRSLEYEDAAVALAAKQNISLAQAVELVTIARLREKQAGFYEGSEAFLAIEKEIQARGKLATMVGIKDQRDQWIELTKDIGRGLTDSLFRAFEAGKGFFSTLWSGIKNLFKTTALKLIINPIGTAVTGALGMSGTANAATGGGDLLGMAGTLGSLGSGLGLLGAGGLGLQAGFGALMTGGFAGVSAAVSGGLAAIGAGTGASIAAGLGTIAGALGPIALGAYAIYSLASGKADSRFGGGYQISAGMDQAVYTGGPTKGFTGDAAVAATVTAASNSINQLLKSIGSAASLATYYGASETSNKGRGGVMAGGTLSTGAMFGDDTVGSNYRGDFYERTSTQSPDSAAAAANFALDLKQSIIQALQATTDIPAIIKGMVAGIDIELSDSAAVDKLLTEINTVVAGVTGFQEAVQALPFAYLRDLSFDTAAAFIKAADGMQALNVKLGNYYDNFYTEEEKKLTAQKNIAAALNSVGFDFDADKIAAMTRQQYRQIYEAHVEAFGPDNPISIMLLNVSASFAAVTPVVEAVTAAVETAGGAMKAAADAAAALAAANKGWTDQLDVLTGKQTERSIALRDATDDSTRALMRQVYAQQDLKTSAEAAATANKLAMDNAFAALQRAVAAEKTRITVIRDVASESVRSITSVFELLKSQVAILYGTVSSSAAMQASQGNAFIDDALSAALSSGYLPDAQDLAAAIAAARGGLDANQFATQFEADKAALVMAGKLSQLQATSGYQLSTAELALKAANDQLTALDESLVFYQQQIDAVNGVNTSVLSVQAAIANLAVALLAQKAAVMAPSASAAAAGYVASLPADKSFNAAAATPVSERDRAVQAIYSSVLGRTADAGGLADFANSSLSISQITASIQGSAEAAARAISVGYQNAFNSAVNSSLGLTSTIKAFAAGGDHFGGLRIVGENGPELEATGPSRIFNASQTRSMLSTGSGNNERLEQLVEGLTAEVQRLQGLMAQSNLNTSRTATAVNGNPDRPVLVEIAA